jgi:predicted transcriptional regulator
MDSSPPVVALLSIKPTYAEAILEGRKKVEFRKTKFQRAVTHIVIYATAPIKRVIGWFMTGDFHESSPTRLWRRFSAVGGISRVPFESYFKGRETGIAIDVHKPRRLKTSLLLARITSKPPPQSYAYLPADVLSLLGEASPKRLPAKRHAARKGRSRRSPDARGLNTRHSAKKKGLMPSLF